MKRTYETPAVEKIAFQYQEQVVAASSNCREQYALEGDLNTSCEHQVSTGKNQN